MKKVQVFVGLFVILLFFNQINGNIQVSKIIGISNYKLAN